MSRYKGPKTRINRRFGMAIFNPKKAFERKPHLPGIHGPRLRRRETEYSLGLLEKQKLRFMFGLTEKQFRNTFERAKNQPGVTGEVFMQMLERRLDNVVYSMGLASSRPAARQLVCHGHVRVNGRKVDIASFQCKPGDVVEVRQKTSSRQLATRNLEQGQFRTPPPWLSVNTDALTGSVNRLPVRSEMDQGINEQLIVEFYSR